MLPGPGESYAWLFWRIFGLVFPVFMIVPGLLYWGLKGRKKTLPVESLEKSSQGSVIETKNEEKLIE